MNGFLLKCGHGDPSMNGLMHSVYNVSGGRAMGRENFFTVEGEVLKFGQGVW
jgi:hypothetical protein